MMGRDISDKITSGSYPAASAVERGHSQSERLRKPRIHLANTSMAEEAVPVLVVEAVIGLEDILPPTPGLSHRELVLNYSDQCGIRDAVEAKITFQESDLDTNGSFRYELYGDHAFARGYVRPFFRFY